LYFLKNLDCTKQLIRTGTVHTIQQERSSVRKSLKQLLQLAAKWTVWLLQMKYLTGWRIGWACAPSTIASAIRNIHIHVTDSAPSPFQEAALAALQSPPGYFKSLKAEYEARRDFVIQMLSDVGFQISFKPQGSVFVFAELPKNWLVSDVGDIAR
ncbi:hypothetical protein GW17_00016219, partial [Ensete ventricosum]